MTPDKLSEVAGLVMPAVHAIEKACTDHVVALFESHPDARIIEATEDEWKRGQDAFGDRDAFYAAMMPTEQDAIRLLHAAYERLKKLDWNDIIYSPKDGSTFDAIEAGSTGIHSTYYMGDWPDGGWWIDDYPSRPILYRRTEAEKARWAKFAPRASSAGEGQP